MNKQRHAHKLFDKMRTCFSTFPYSHQIHLFFDLYAQENGKLE